MLETKFGIDTPKKIIISESEDYSEKAIARLSAFGEVVKLTSLDELEANLETADILVVRLGLMLDAGVLSKASQLKYILTPTTGLDHIDINYTEKVGIKVISLKGEQSYLDSIPSTAEHTMALLLSIVRKVPFAFNHVLDYGWDRQAFRGNNLKGKKLGLLGFGRIGHQVANYGFAFSMNVATFDPDSTYINPKVKFFTTPEELFSYSDILCIHIPINEENIHYISAEKIKFFKKGIILVNTSRGGVWDEDEIAKDLKRGNIGAIATDVLENEFDSHLRSQSPLIALAKAGYPVLITPHIGGATYESMRETEDFIVDKFINNLSVQ